ncbi:alpha-1,4-N-acetylglucosaminyltransferase-like [Pelodiscus sinensis]|uniref:alpha-1,4-N-acetylglucosaminyltransferase-like n=1 Tax=Pelodiscus sinensis TaxID=13735 RepID=UPI003F6B4862
MLKEIQIVLCFFFVCVFVILYEFSLQPVCVFSRKPIAKPFLTEEDVMNQSRSIIFVETTDRLQPPPLVACSVESAARIYPDRPVVFFMKGLKNNTRLDSNSTSSASSLLSAMKNVFLFPLQMESLFQGTPLLPWYHKVNAAQEKHWVHIISDASRLALLWKYGGIYMDTDVISIRPIPVAKFLAAQASQFSSNGILGFPHHHWFIWDCMEDFVENYNGGIWGNQGPMLMTRRLRALCTLSDFHNVEDLSCQNISFLHPQRFYPIAYEGWRQYYEIWETSPDFSNSYALHLWNFMNQEHKPVVAGSNTLVENLFKTHCPTTYKALILGTKCSGPCASKQD